MKYDVIVIGAGPAGSTVSSLLIEKGIDSVLLLDRARFPRPKPCAGGISPKSLHVLKDLGLMEEIMEILGESLYPIRGAKIGTPSGRNLIFAGNDEAAVAPRSLFDTALLKIASKRGTIIKEEAEVRSISRSGKDVRVILSSGEVFTAQYAINASGAGSRFRLPVPREDIMTSCMGWYEGIPYTSNRLEMIFDPSLAPHYGWLFPENDTRCNVGICLLNRNRKGRSVVDIYNDFLQKHFLPRCKGNTLTPIGTLRVFPLICSLPSRLHKMEDRCLRIGEAAGLVHPFTGEGVSFALKSANLAAEVLVKGVTARRSFSYIEEEYRNLLKKNFEGTLRFSSVMKACSAGFLNATSLISFQPFTNVIGKVFSKI